MRFIDLTGKRFGKLTVLRRFDFGKKHIKWLCHCDCGTEKAINGDALKYDLTKTCGCGAASGERNGNFKHGSCRNYKGTKEYRAWVKAKGRVNNPGDNKYHQYGARGIRMCLSWQNSFSDFINDMGKCPEGLTLDRIDVNGDYEPSNCRWATNQEQAYNKQNTIYMPSGIPFKRFCIKHGLNYKQLHFKYKNGNLSLHDMEQRYDVQHSGGVNIKA